MNENPGPNPLAPNQSTGGAPQPVQPMQPAQATQPTQPMQATQPATETASVMVESLDPEGRPMEQVVPAPEQPKKKTGLIVGIIIAAVVLICGIVAAVVVMMNMNNKPDAVGAAITKLMSSEAPTNVAIDGTIDILPNSNDLPISRVSITLESGLAFGPNINTAAAVVTLVDNDGNDYSMEFNEVYASNGDLYLKIEGATAALEDSGLLDMLYEAASVQDCSTDSYGETYCVDTLLAEPIDCSDAEGCEADVLTWDDDLVYGEEIDIDEPYGSSLGMLGAMSDGILDIIETVDGIWIRVSTEDMGFLTDGITSNSTISCVTSLVNDINTNSNSAIELYNKYPFYTSASEGIVVASKGNPIYKLGIDSKNFANFVNSINNAELTNDLYGCLGWNGNVAITEEDVTEVAATLPEMYVEVDTNDNFTRFYAKSEVAGGAETIVDLTFSYPTNINVSEPVEYTDLSDIIQEIMTSMFTLPEDVVVEEETTVEVTE